MNNYKNVSGLQTGITAGVGLAVNTISGLSGAKKQREAQEKLAKLSLAQKAELEKRLQDTNSDLQRQNIMYQTFAVLENQKLVDGRKNKQLILFYFLGGGVILLVGMGLYFNFAKK